MSGPSIQLAWNELCLKLGWNQRMLVWVVINSGTWKGSSVLAQPVIQYDELNISIVH